MRIAVVAPSSRFDDWREVGGAGARDRRRARIPGVEIDFHPQCVARRQSFRRHRRRARADALVEVANDPGVRRDLVRARRLRLEPDRRAARSPASARRRATRPGSAIATPASCSPASTAPAIPNVAHGPMPQDVMRDGRRGGGRRARSAWLVRRDRRRAGAAGSSRARATPRSTSPCFGMLLGTPLEPDLAGHVLLLEEVSEHMYATDRALFHITASANVRRVAGHPARPGQRRAAQRSRLRRGRGGGGPPLVRARRNPLSRAAPISATIRPTRWSRSVSFEDLSRALSTEKARRVAPNRRHFSLSSPLPRRWICALSSASESTGREEWHRYRAVCSVR